MWYKDEANGSHIFLAESSDLFTWNVVGPTEASRGQEAPNVFRMGGFYWMLTDSGGLNLYRSKDALAWDDLGPFMHDAGSRKDDDYVAQHPDVIVLDQSTYIVYFVHPYGKEHVEPGKHRSVLQIAKLEVRDGLLTAVRNDPFNLELTPPQAGLYHGE
jgi:sucrose-6-phosphate hydrolase SacC (GH32 family)